MAKREVISCTSRARTTVDASCLDNTRIYGIKHRNCSRTNLKRYKLHRKSNGMYEAIGFINSTGHLNEREGFDSLADAHAYCVEHKHSMIEFDSAREFADWLRAGC